MNNEIYCPNCKMEVELDAIFCGNCGFKLKDQTPDLNGGTIINNYAIRYPHRREHWPTNSLIVAIVSIAASLIFPILGIVLAVFAIIMASFSLKKANFILRLLGIIFATLALLISLWTIIYNSSPKHTTTQSATSVLISTPCYKIKVSSIFNIQNNKNSCNIKFYYGNNIASASDLYIIRAQFINNLNTSLFNHKANVILNNDIRSHIKGVLILGSSNSKFVNSPAYKLRGYSASQNITISEMIVLHKNSLKKANFFDIVHSQLGKNLKSNNLNKSWQWIY